MGFSRVGLCAGGVGLVLVLVGCSAILGATPLPDGLGYVRSGSHVLVLHPHQDANGDALIGGPLGVNARGCVTVGSSVIMTDAGNHFVDPDHVALAGHTYALGQRVEGGGGVNGSTSTDLDRALRSLCGVGIDGTAYVDL